MSNCLFASDKAVELRVAYFSQDPPSITPLSPSFDPDSYAVITQIFDPLVMFDLEGNPIPALATKWHRENPVKWRFWLRKGVKFHNGDLFDGNDVLATFNYILEPKNKAGNSWIFDSFDSVSLDPSDPFQVVITTKYPDGMFINRLNMFSSILSSDDIFKGLSHLERKPNGTGPFKLARWRRGVEVKLERNNAHWNKDLVGNVDVSFKLLEKEIWVEALINNTVDFVPNLEGSMTLRVMNEGKGSIKIIKRPILAGYWALIKNQGVLADKAIRQALNYAINRDDIVRLADHGNAIPLASIGKVGEYGRNEALQPISFAPDLAKKIILEKGLQGKIHLKILTADISELVARIVVKNLQSVGVTADLEVVSRSEWSKRIIHKKISTGKLADYDIAINLVDNPIYHLGFHAGLFLQSTSPWSLLNSPEYDTLFIDAMTQDKEQVHLQKLKALDKYIQENALMLFTSQRIITAAHSNLFNIQNYAKNGHLGYLVLSNVTHVATEPEH